MADYLHRDTQGPAPDGYHVPTQTEWQAVYDMGVALGQWSSSNGNGMRIKLKLPFAGYRDYSSSDAINQGSYAYYWTSNTTSKYSYFLSFGSTTLATKNYDVRSYGRPVRCFKNSPVAPDNSWTKIYVGDVASTGIYRSQGLGLISIRSSISQTWITIADKNLGATAVYNDGEELSEANCGYYYQWGNNYGFLWSGTISKKSSTGVNASTYGPGNYYNSDTWITAGSWDTSVNNNLRGGVTDERPSAPIFSYTGLFRYDENDTEHTNPLKPTQTITIAPAGFPDITETVGSYLNRIASGWKTVEGYTFSKINIVNHHGDIEKEVSENYIPTLEDFEDDNSISFLIQFKQKRIIKKIKKIMNNGQEYRIDAVPAGGNTGDLLIKEGDGEKWGKVDVGVMGSGVKNMKVLTKDAFNSITRKEDNVIYLIGQGATDIILNTSKISFEHGGQSEQIDATLVPSNSINKLMYESLDENIVSVNSNGLAISKGSGKTSIVVKTDDGRISKEVSVVSGGLPVEFLLIGGGGAGGSTSCSDCAGGGGGAGQVISCTGYAVAPGTYDICIGGSSGGNGCPSSALGLTAVGGSAGGYGGGYGGSSGNGYSGGATCACCINGYWYIGGGGGAGARGNGYKPSGCRTGGQGGMGITSSITGTSQQYAGGGGGGGCSGGGVGQYGGGCGGDYRLSGGMGSTCGSGGGGAAKCGRGYGAGGLFVLRYPTSCGYEAEGGTKTTVGDYTIHTFCSNGTFSIDSPYKVKYLIVGGGGAGGGNSGTDAIGGGAGQIIEGELQLSGGVLNDGIDIQIGEGGSIGNNGGKTYLKQNTTILAEADGGYNNGYSGGCLFAPGTGAGGGAGACGNGGNAGGNGFSCVSGGRGGDGACGFAGGGGGGGYIYQGGKSACGGGNGGYSTTNGDWYDIESPGRTYGSGGGGAPASYNPRGMRGGPGHSGAAFICYPTECGYNLTGGKKYTEGEYTVHLFEEDGVIATGAHTVEYVLVGGGGGGDAATGYWSGGGGGGGVRTGLLSFVGDTLSVNIGEGGAAGGSAGCDGQNSSIGNVVAQGGKGATGTTGGTSGNGFAGGYCNCGYGGGGGGAGGAGQAGYDQSGGMGGVGLCTWGGCFGGGGSTSGSKRCQDSVGYGGGYHGGDGVANTGGGGAGTQAGWSTGKGGSGIAKIRYKTGEMSATGGTITTEGEYTVHTFTSTGTFTVN